MIAAMADASFAKSQFHLERYELAVLSESRAHPERLRRQAGRRTGCRRPRRPACAGQRRLAANLKRHAADTLDKVLFELSSQMKNAYSRSDA